MGSYFAVCNTNYKFISRWPVPRQTSVRAIQLQDLGVLHLQSSAAFALLLSIAPMGCLQFHTCFIIGNTS